ncbi:hypothetical protein QQG55_24835 [Brugia pahangi]|uniref:Secreted protein n=1 Tax=Brugia pahangi TaxID=6280 RepID=A0A0N4SYR6_BRUPA|nr:unnamed protein product [Brugia pahangi]
MLPVKLRFAQRVFVPFAKCMVEGHRGITGDCCRQRLGWCLRYDGLVYVVRLQAHAARLFASILNCAATNSL